MPQPNPQPAAAAAIRHVTIIAKPSHHFRDYRVKRFAIVAMLVIFGLWFAKDGFYSWPAENQKIEDLKKIQKRIKKDYRLALDLYDTGIHDAMYLAGLIADDAKMTKQIGRAHV